LTLGLFPDNEKETEEEEKEMFFHGRCGFGDRLKNGHEYNIQKM
jgi:hypothetical protein